MAAVGIPVAAERLLHRRQQRRRLEDRPTTAASGRRSSTTSRPARSAPSPSRRPIPNVIYVGSGEGLQRPDLSTGDGIYKSVDGGKTWTHLGLRDGQQIPQIAVDPRDPDRLFVAVLGHPYGPNAGARHLPLRSTAAGRSRRSSTATRTPAASTSSSIPSNPQIVYAVLWEAAARAVGERRLHRPGQRPLQVDRRRHDLAAAHQGAARDRRAPRPRRHSRSRRESATPLRHRRHDAESGGLYRSDDAGESWQRVNDDARLWGRPGDFAEVQRRSEERRHRLRRQHRDLEVDRRRQDLHRASAARPAATTTTASGSTPTTRTSSSTPPIRARSSPSTAARPGAPGTTSRPRRSTTSPPTTPSPTASAAASRRAARPACRAAATTDRSPSATGPGRRRGVRLRRPRSARSRHRLRRHGSRATTAARGQAENVSPKPLRGEGYRVVRTQPLVFSPPIRASSTSPRTRVWKTTNGGRAWTEISPDLTRKDWTAPPNVGKYTGTPAAQPRQRGVDLRPRAVAARRQPHLGRHRRRPHSRHHATAARRWTRRHAVRARAVGEGLDHGRVALRRADRLRRRSTPSASTTSARTSTARATAARRWTHITQRHPRRRDRQRRARRPEDARPALRRHARTRSTSPSTTATTGSRCA